MHNRPVSCTLSQSPQRCPKVVSQCARQAHTPWQCVRRRGGTLGAPDTCQVHKPEKICEQAGSGLQARLVHAKLTPYQVREVGWGLGACLVHAKLTPHHSA